MFFRMVLYFSLYLYHNLTLPILKHIDCLFAIINNAVVNILIYIFLHILVYKILDYLRFKKIILLFSYRI